MSSTLQRSLTLSIASPFGSSAAASAVPPQSRKTGICRHTLRPDGPIVGPLITVDFLVRKGVKPRLCASRSSKLFGQSGLTFGAVLKGPRLLGLAAGSAEYSHGVSSVVTRGGSEGLNIGETMEGIEELFKERLVETTEGHFTCSRGVKLFTRTWTPTKVKPKALVCILHGFGSNISWLSQKTALLFTDAGYAVAGLDAQGFGRSDGLDGYIPDFDHLVLDASEFFGTVRKSDRFRTLPAFLYGESMGGAIALLISLQEPGEWAGAVLSAPMVKILDKYRPPWILEQIGLLLVHVIPTWPIVPVRNRIDNSFRDPAKCEIAKKDPYVYVKKPRLKTGQELLRVTMHLQQRLQDVTIPFLVLHGTLDTVTDIEVSQALYEQASSSDKTIKKYPDGYHALLQGEPEEQRQRIADDIVAWIDKRAHACTNAGGKAALRDAELVDRVLTDA